MTSLLVFLFAVVVTLPFVAWYAVYIVTVKWTKRKGKAIRLAADSSTFLFILSVHFMIITLWGKSMFWLLLLIILMTGVVFTILHYRSREDVEFFKLIKGVWRFNFFLFVGGYLMLIVYGLTRYLLSAFLV